MRENLRSKLSFANVTSALALFVALGGTSYAAITLPRNSVGSKQVRSGAIGASELRNSAVRSSDVRNRSLQLRDISRSARDSLRGQTGLWRYSYRVEAVSGRVTFRFRARIRKESDFPFELGRSRQVRVTVRGI